MTAATWQDRADLAERTDATDIAFVSLDLMPDRGPSVQCEESPACSTQI